MADLAVQKTTLAGLNPVLAPADVAGDMFTNTGRETLRVVTGATPVVVTVVAQNPCNHGVLHPQVVNVPANDDREIGPFRDEVRWNDENDKVHVTYDQVVNVTVGVFD